jgi:hypothetical protein
MIESAQDFVRFRTSELPEEQHRATHEEAAESVWHAVIAGFPEMREWVALNKTVPIEILGVLSRDSNARVRFAVAMKRKLPEELQLVLARDNDESVRQRIAYNKKATRKVLQILADDVELRIREKAVERLETGDYVA